MELESVFNNVKRVSKKINMENKSVDRLASRKIIKKNSCENKKKERKDKSKKMSLSKTLKLKKPLLVSKTKTGLKKKIESIKVVKIINSEPYRTILKKGEYEKNKKGQIFLPKDYYSCGFFERISGRDWSKLPKLIEKPKAKVKTESKRKSNS